MYPLHLATSGNPSSFEQIPYFGECVLVLLARFSTLRNVGFDQSSCYFVYRTLHPETPFSLHS